LKGHVTLIEFFRINCPHCSQEAAPLLKKLHAKYSSRGLKIIAFHAPGKSPNEHDWKQVRTVLEKEWNSPYPVAFDEGGKLFRGKFNGAWYPTILVLDRNLTVKLAQIGLTPESAKQVEKQIQQELAASS
jgi:thiol-disulfide isomerase/thioredoxin